MQTKVEILFGSAATFAGVAVSTMVLQKGQDITDSFKLEKPENRSHLLFIIGSGSLSVDDKTVGADQILAIKFDYPGSIYANEEDTFLFVVKLNDLADHELNEIWIKDLPKPNFYNKYKAAISKIDLTGNGSSLLGEWSSYIVELPFVPQITLHYHKDLRNILYFTGSPSEIQGYLLVENNNQIHAWPVRGGDWAVVETNVVHNVCAAKDHTMRFFVFNDEPSDYETPETSDYHNLHIINFEEIQRMPETTSKSPIFISATTIS